MFDKVQKSSVCYVPSCDKQSWCKDYCPAHYQKFRKYGYVPNTPIAKFAAKGSNPTCSLDSCTRKHHAKGLCHTHYTQSIRRLKVGRV